jgi:hypothetical protein
MSAAAKQLPSRRIDLVLVVLVVCVIVACMTLVLGYSLIIGAIFGYF